MILALAGGDPIAIFAHILRSSFGSLGVLSDTLVKATPLILTGLACALAFRMRLWNIGAEGQLLMGAWGASAVVLVPIVPAGHAVDHHDPADDGRRRCSCGGAYGAIPGFLKAVRGVNEIIVTLMLNYIAAPLDLVLGLRAVERGRLPAHPAVPAARPGCPASPTSPRRSRPSPA